MHGNPANSTARPNAARTLIDALGLDTRPGAEVQDLYSRPVGAAVIVLRRHEGGGDSGRAAA